MTEQNPPAGKPQFTPGPWVWWTSNSWRRLRAGLRGERNVAVPLVARDGHPDIDISELDMALIAAAPDLYAALEEIVDHSDNPISAHEVAQNHKDAGNPISVPEALAIIKAAHDARIARARAALAKARGETE